MKKLIAIFLVITFLGMNCAFVKGYRKSEKELLGSGGKPGAYLIIQKKDYTQEKGELIAVKENSLLLKDSKTYSDVSIDINDIYYIKIKKRSSGMLGAGLGLLLGFGIPALKASSEEGQYALGWWIVAVGGGILGLIIGGIAGASIKTYESIPFEEKSDSEIKEILEELRKKARIPDFQ